MTGDKLSTLVCSNGFGCEGVEDDADDDEEDDEESSSNSPANAAATTLLNSGNISFVTKSDFNVPSYKITKIHKQNKN